MIEETGLIVEADADYAVIETQRTSACDQCHSNDECGTSVLSSLFGDKRQRIRLENHLGLKTGDRAVIGINEHVLLKTALLAYMLPLVLMIVVSVFMSVSGASDSLVFVAGLLTLVAGLMISNRITKREGFGKNDITLLRNASEIVVPNFLNRSN